MGLADRDYMRERAQYRRDQRPSGPPRKPNGILLILAAVGGAVVAIAMVQPPPAAPAATVVPAEVQQRTIDTVTVQSSVPPQAVAPVRPAEPDASMATVPLPPVRQDVADRRELVHVLNGARTQDLSHVVASSVGDTGGYFPANGATEWFVPIDSSLRTGRLTIVDLEGTQAAKLIRIRQAETGFVIVQIYIQAGQGGFVDLPLGNYTLTVAKGERWYGRPKYFGPEGAYLNALQLVQMTPEGATERLLPSDGPGRRMMAQPTYAF